MTPPGANRRSKRKRQWAWLKVMALVYHGEGAIQKVRNICGATNPEEAEFLINEAQEQVQQKWRMYERAGYQGKERRGVTDVHPDAGS